MIDGRRPARATAATPPAGTRSRQILILLGLVVVAIIAVGWLSGDRLLCAR